MLIEHAPIFSGTNKSVLPKLVYLLFSQNKFKYIQLWKTTQPVTINSERPKVCSLHCIELHTTVQHAPPQKESIWLICPSRVPFFATASRAQNAPSSHSESSPKTCAFLLVFCTASGRTRMPEEDASQIDACARKQVFRATSPKLCPCPFVNFWSHWKS